MEDATIALALKGAEIQGEINDILLDVAETRLDAGRNRNRNREGERTT